MTKRQLVALVAVLGSACGRLVVPVDAGLDATADAEPARDSGPSDGGTVVDTGVDRDGGFIDSGSRDAGLDAGPEDAGPPVHELEVTKSGPGDGVITSQPSGIDCGDDCAASFADGEVVSLTAQPASFARFVGWTGPCSGTDTCIVSVEEATTVIAVFDIRPQVAVGGSHTCAVSSAGAVRCWGNGLFGKLGHDAEDNIGDGIGDSITAAGDIDVGFAVASLGLARFHSCAISAAGSLRCWGPGSDGRLGLGSTIDVADGIGPTIRMAGDVPVGAPVAKVDGGFGHTCALLRNGSVRCWGRNREGQLGYGHMNNVGDGVGASIIAAGDVPIGASAIDMCTGDLFSCAVIAGGQVRCWGSGNAGELGYGAVTAVGNGVGPSIASIGSVPIGTTVRSISCGTTHVCVVTSSDAVRCWGDGAEGRLGHNNTNSIGDGAGAPIATSGDVPVGGPVSRVIASAAHSCALLQDGSVRCWGSGLGGRLGNESTDDVGDGGLMRSILEAGTVPIAASATYLAGQAASSHTCVVTDTNAVRCWGYGADGRLGYGGEGNVGDGVGPAIAAVGDVSIW